MMQVQIRRFFQFWVPGNEDQRLPVMVITHINPGRKKKKKKGKKKKKRGNKKEQDRLYFSTSLGNLRI